MTRPGLWPLGAIGIVILVLSVGAGWVFAPAHAYAGLTALVLCLPAAVATVWGTGRLAARTRYAGLIGMAAGTIARTATAVGGGAAVFWAAPVFRDGFRYGFWVWVLGVYLVMLVAETAILARYFLVTAADGRENAA